MAPVIPEALLLRIEALAASLPRCLVAIVGAPGSGKSTFAEALCAGLTARAPGSAAIVPMDGYHLDNAVLDAHGWRARKGAPHTFDVEALARDLARLRAAKASVFVPVFDRGLDLARASAREITAGCRVVVVEGNYLLLDQVPWQGLASLFDLSLCLRVSEAVLEDRLIRRWLDQGLSAEHARHKALGNDLPNARLVMGESRVADVHVHNE